ncbi:MAG: folylpolyglutamate synthase/dihydrofolate synthase family protein [Enterococcus aquimarinus]
MIKTVEEAIEWIHSRLPFGMRPGLDRVKALLELIDNPEQNLQMIHVAGTNGKGSTVSYLSCMLQELGLSVGTFTSPFIEVFNERIAINGQWIPDEAIIRLVNKYQPFVALLDDQPTVAGITEFELLTVMGLDYFQEQQVDVAIIEVGLGGLLDSTNVIEPILTAITTIGMDHTDILGETLEDIATQKAGIIKPNVPLVTGKIEEAALKVIKETAMKQNAPIKCFEEDYQVVYQGPDSKWGEIFDFYNEAGKIKNIKTPLLGEHQIENASLAIELFFSYCHLKQIPIKQEWIINGLAQTHWPARMEKISDEPFIVMDGAHNNHAMKRLVENVMREFPQRKIWILFSALETKDITQMLAELARIPSSELLVTTFDHPKALNIEKLKSMNSVTSIKTAAAWQLGLADLLEKSMADDLILITGSLYFVSEIRQFLLNH